MGLDGRLKRLESHQAACSHWDGKRPNVMLWNATPDDVARMQETLSTCQSCRRRGGPPKIFIYRHPDLEQPE